MKNINTLQIVVLFFSLSFNQAHSNVKFKTTSENLPINKTRDLISNKIHHHKTNFIVDPPVLTATGNQIYCPLSTINILTDFTITHDSAEIGTEAIYIQISSGYTAGSDTLKLSNPQNHLAIKTTWDSLAGKLKLSSSSTTVGTIIPYSELVSAIKDVVFTSTNATLSGTKTFSITIGQANYLPSSNHYYLYVTNLGINWADAKTAAENMNYHGLKGYLATITTLEEALFVGTQCSGTGWIGASDALLEGEWKWVTGPEEGTVFWRGTGDTGSAVTFAYWNDIEYLEPNNIPDNENFAHITQPGIGRPGSWNDLNGEDVSSDPDDDYSPKGYVVEFGGMPNDPVISQIATTSQITVPTLTITSPAPICDSETITITATVTPQTEISWYASATSLTPLAKGNSFTTPSINATTTFYAGIENCQSIRKAITVSTIATPPTPVAVSSNVYRCGPGTAIIEIEPTTNIINWFTTPSGGNSIHTGNTFETPSLSTNTTYYAEASNDSRCINSTRTPISITIYTPPRIADQEVFICQNGSKILDAELSGLTYLWSTNETTQKIEVTTSGTYTVDITSASPENCTTRKTITVTELEVPVIKNINIKNQTVTITLLSPQNYFEYSIDGISFYDSNIFYNVPGGIQTAYVRDKSGCKLITQNFIVIEFPTFFTPNNDSYNDQWEVIGMENYPQSEVMIYDRYGKFITQLNQSNRSWDGTYNKTPLPSSDYWYAFKIDNTKPIIKGHFSLKR